MSGHVNLLPACNTGSGPEVAEKGDGARQPMLGDAWRPACAGHPHSTVNPVLVCERHRLLPSGMVARRLLLGALLQGCRQAHAPAPSSWQLGTLRLWANAFDMFGAQDGHSGGLGSASRTCHHPGT